MRAPALPSLALSHWEVQWPLWSTLLTCALLYTLLALRLGRRWPTRRTLAFQAGIAAMLIALQSGIGSYDDRLLSVHMVQHMILLLAAPLLLLLGKPVILILRTLPASQRPRLIRLLERPRFLTGALPCLLVFSMVVLATHLPSFYDATLKHPLLHDAEHALYVTAGLLLWWPILDADPLPRRRLGGLARLGYLLVAMLPMAIVGAYLNRHPSLAYVGYAAPARALGVSALTDQAQAGAIMWVVGNTIMVAVGLIGAVRALVAEERRQRARDARADIGTLP